MDLLVTGASGFLGSECARQLRAAGYQVATTDRLGSAERIGNLADKTFVSSLPRVDAVVHCAAVQYVTPHLPLLRRARFFELNNVLATRMLCERYAGTGTYMVNIGTSMMYHQCQQTLYDVNDAMVGQGVYSSSKLAAWRDVQRLFPDSATIQPCIIGGIGREGLFRGFVNSIRSFGVAMYPGSGAHRTHMVHVQDVAALVTEIVRQRPSGVFNAAGPNPLSIQDWVGIIADELKLPAPRSIRLPLAPLRALSALSGYRILAREQLLMLAQSHVLATTTSLALGWQPQFDNERIVRDIANYIVRSDGGVARSR